MHRSLALRRACPARGRRTARAASSAVHVLACATEYRQETAILQRSAKRNGFRFHTVGLGEPWRGFATKFLAYERRLRELRERLPPEQLVMLLDAWDTPTHHPNSPHLPRASSPSEGWLLCGAERVCGPNHFLVAQIEALFPDGHTPWRYPNSGGLVGPLEVMLELLHDLVHDTERAQLGQENGLALPAEENDQVRLHDFLIARAAQGRAFPMRLDTDCEVFQCMYEEQPQWQVDLSGQKPRLRNQLTQSQPLVAHGNGHTGRKLLDHLGLSMAELQHLQHEMPVPPGTEVTEEIKAEYCPWWYMPGCSS
ncbi:Uncharacterized protein R699 [Durusdinium trenchii]|uniref:Uncharacterized protein R699 n=1 Tax=Durusdinium trenchii TaxID=1381693 RepID=A0ABP0KF32_9DINO